MRHRPLSWLGLLSMLVVRSASADTDPPPAPVSQTPARDPATFGSAMQAYHEALAKRRLGSQTTFNLSDLETRVADAEEMSQVGRIDDAITTLTELVEHPRFSAFAEDEAGRAAVYRLGDALATAGIYVSARAYLRRVLATRATWDNGGPYARRAVRRLVEIALETHQFGNGIDDLAGLPSDIPSDVRGERSYLAGRAKEAAGDPDGALAAYAEVEKTSRFWAQATYLQGLIDVEKQRFEEGENFFCKVADPALQTKTTPVFADERFFAIRDLARLALGRVAHEEARFDDARYYYYLVPRDSDRLAEALYEGATTRYEKKDYEAARELLDELHELEPRNRYEDEAAILDLYIDLALCRFDDADRKSAAFFTRYEPARMTARRAAADDRTARTWLTAMRTKARVRDQKTDPSVDVAGTLAMLVRVDASFGEIEQWLAVIDHQVSALRVSGKTLTSMEQGLAGGEVRSAVQEAEDTSEKAAAVRVSIEGVRKAIDDLVAANAPPEQVKSMLGDLASLEARLPASTDKKVDPATQANATGHGDIVDLFAVDDARVVVLLASLDAARRELTVAQTLLMKDALHRLDLRLSRLLRRAKLGRIEAVLGRKHALEIEIEALNKGFLPHGALDSLNTVYYLKSNEEYWPFEGDNWPDEYIGTEGKP